MPERELIKMLLYCYAMDGGLGCAESMAYYPADVAEVMAGSIMEEAGKHLTECASLVLAPGAIYGYPQVEEWADALLAKWTLMYAELAPKPSEE